MFKSNHFIQQALQGLGRDLALAFANEIDLLVCGGAGLNALGLMGRPTRDVDVLAIIREGELSEGEELPDEVIQGVIKTARNFGLSPDWLNMEATSLLKLGLPKGILKRSHKKTYGPVLTVYFIDRKDQICLKLFAAMDAKTGNRHLEDLRILKPTVSETRFAKAWMMRWESSEAFKMRIKELTQAFE